MMHLASLRPVTVGVLALAFVAQADSFVLTGTRLQVGVGSDGILADDSWLAGLRYDHTAAGSFGGDWVLSGAPWEFITFTVDGVDYGPSGIGTPLLGFETLETSAGGLLGARTRGMVGSLFYDSTLSFAEGSAEVMFTVTLTNPSHDPVYEVYFARGVDADPYGSLVTINTYGTSFDEVTARGLHGGSVTVRDLSGSGVVGMDELWGGGESALGLFTAATMPGGVGDRALNVSYHASEIGPAGSVTWEFEYVVVPEPGLMAVGMGAAAALTVVGLRRRRR